MVTLQIIGDLYVEKFVFNEKFLTLAHDYKFISNTYRAITLPGTIQSH
jgi:hypothetical protein